MGKEAKKREKKEKRGKREKSGVLESIFVKIGYVLSFHEVDLISSDIRKVLLKRDFFVPASTSQSYCAIRFDQNEGKVDSFLNDGDKKNGGDVSGDRCRFRDGDFLRRFQHVSLDAPSLFAEFDNASKIRAKLIDEKFGGKEDELYQGCDDNDAINEGGKKDLKYGRRTYCEQSKQLDSEIDSWKEADVLTAHIKDGVIRSIRCENLEACILDIECL